MQGFRIAHVAAVALVLVWSAGLVAAEEPAATPATPPAPVEPASADAPQVSEKVRQLMQDRKYAEAVKAIDEAAAQKDAPVDYLVYLKGRAYYLNKQYDEAIKVFDEHQAKFPASPWARRARFGKALALARSGDFRAAEQIYRAEAEYLLSPDRKQEIAGIYLEFADKFFKPPKEEEKPDYQKALEFYQKALEVGPKAEKRIEVELLVAKCRQKLGNNAEAAAAYEAFIKQHPESPLGVEARFCLGECRLAEGNAREARRVWQDLLAKYVDSPSDRVAEAAFQLSRTWNIPQPENNEQLSLGVAALEAFVEKFPTHKLASQAHLDIARSYIHRGRYEDAVKALTRFLADERYKDRPEVPDARNLLGRSYQLQGKFTEALATWREFLAKHPAHQAWSSVQQEIVNTEFLMAEWQRRDGQYDAARQLWTEFLAKYPLDPRGPQILYTFGEMKFKQEQWDVAIADWRRLVSKYPNTDWSSRGQFMIGVTLEQKLGKLEEALEQYRKVTWGDHATQAQLAIARLTAKSMTVQTERVFRSDETPRLKLVTRNIESVTVRAYKVDLETYFRKMHLAGDVESLDIALIDPDKTFEFKVPNYAKYQELENSVEVPLPGDAHSGVLAVTVSSSTLEATTLVLQSDLDIIVKSSRDEVFVFAENMRTGKPWKGARLLVSNGQQVFAEGQTGEDGTFQQTYKELADAADVRVFAIADGHVASNVVSLEGVGVARGLSDKGYLYTDRPAYRAGQLVNLRGCIRHVPGSTRPGVERLPPTEPAVEVPVPAEAVPELPPPEAAIPVQPPAPPAPVPPPPPPVQPAPPQPAPPPPMAPAAAPPGADPFGPPAPSADAAPSGPGPVPAAAPAAAPAPAPAAKPAEDAYTIQSGKKFTLQVFDSRNRPVRQVDVTLDAFGCFHDHFILPPTSPQGQYRVLLQDTEGQSYQGSFQVQEFKLEPVRLVVDTPRHVYYRGEEIEGKIRAEFYYGAPLVDREIRYQLADEPLQTAKTDAKGEIRFKLPTRDFSEFQVLPLTVTLPERNLQTAVNFVLATQGFSVEVETVRPVYVAGETFEVSVVAKDAEGKPVAEKLTLSVLQKTKVQGKVGETLVEKHDLETAAADGSARQTLKLDKGGRYVLRIEGMDRFKNPIWGQRVVQISDDADKVRLRILAEKHTFKVGDTAQVRLHWREKPALALVTFQGARVIEYRLVELATGDNKLDIPMTAKLAPNFELAVAVMTDQKGEAKKKVTLPGDKPGEAAESPLPEGEGDDEPASAVNPFDTGANPAADSPHPSPLPEGEGAAASDPDAQPAPEGEGEDMPRRFHEASSPFTVERDLKVAVSYKRKDDAQGPVRPGEEIEVTVTTTDPQGKPVAAEVSLAMVEKSLLDRFAWPVPPIQDFFRGEPRQSAVRTTSSITFVYRPETQFINPQLLAEKERLEIEAEEAASIAAGTGGGMGGMGSMTAAPGGNTALSPAARPAPPPADGGFAAGGEMAQQPAQFDLPALDVRVQRQAAGQSQRGAVSRFGGRAGRRSGSGAVPTNGGYADFDSLIDLITGQVTPESWSYTAPSGEALLERSKVQHFKQVQVLDSSGRVRNLNLSAWGELDQKKAEAVAAELAKAGTVLLPGLGPQETGYWNPAVQTGPEGKATLTVTMPERTTAWTFMAKGITQETLAGEATAEVTVKKDLFGEMKLPLAFTDGDEADVAVSVHNDAVDKGPIEVTLKTTIGGRTVEEKKTVDVQSKGIHELSFHVALARPEPPKDDKAPAADPQVNVAFELVVSAAGQTDVARAAVPLEPYGVPVYVAASGSATSDTTAWVEAPKDMPWQRPSLQILVGPTVERSLLDVVLAPAPWCQIESGRIASGLETASSDLMACLGLEKLLGASREVGNPQAQAIDARVRASISLLVSAQHDDGGWSWTGGGKKGNRYVTARVVWALSLARAAGYTVPDDTYAKAVAYLRTQVAESDAADYETKAILLQALAAAGEGDFALANRLYRERPTLSPGALAYLALAFAAMDRKPTAIELLDLLGQKNLDEPGSRRLGAQGTLPWSQSPAELRALYALAMLEANPQSPKAKEAVDWLLAHRTGNRWSPDKATGPAALALCRWFAVSRFEGEKYQLTVSVNDFQAGVLQIDPASTTQVIDVPAHFLLEGKQRINFQLTGRGRYTYQCTLGGFVAADQLKSTTNQWEIRRTYEPAPLEMDGKEVPRGFAVLEGNYTSFRNPLSQLPVGRRGIVELEIWRRDLPANVPEEQLEYLVVTEPLPSGTSVVESSVQGPFERFEVAPGQITFYVGNRQYVGTIRYELVGYLPGKYRAAPSLLRDAYRPERLAVSAPKPLSVLPMGAKSDDPYRLTPQELYELGKRSFDKHDYATAQTHLTELLDKWNLRAEVYKDTVSKLLDVHLELGPAAKVVHYFEIVKEKWPGEEIPFEKIVKVGAAYHEMGEYERSYLVFRATVESSFGRESGVAGFLDAQGEFLRSVDVMGRLLREYPPEGYTASATYSLAQRVYAKAPEAAADENLRKAKVNRVDLVRRAWTMLEGFLTAYPDDPAADQAGFAAANALLELEAYPQTIEACNRYVERYPQSELLDSYWYIIGYCDFATGKDDQALAMCRKVAEAKHVDKATGREEESPNKWRAIYILGQVYHSQGEAPEAIREYTRVEDRFPDAKEAIEYFTRKAIELPEVSTFKPGEPVEVELKFRNIPACDTKVYRIDLMKFSLLKRSLGEITQINLAGIRPYHEASIALGDGKDYRDRTQKLVLPLKDEGAYLVVCRGENLYASGLVLVTPLAVEVQEDAVSGRVRTTVKDVAANRYVSDVHVKVIGSRNEDFISGKTDLRGVFVADRVLGTSTVIAQADASRYAFFRGQTDLVPEVAVPAAPAEKPAEAAAPEPSVDMQLLEGLQQTNKANQAIQVEQLQQMYQAPKAGVKAEKAF